MQLPPDSASPRARYLYARYVARGLDRSGFEDLLEMVNKANATLLSATRAHEDQEIPLEEAVCDRTQCDAELDDTARVVKFQLGARGPRAARERPSTDIFPKGLEEYVLASQAEQRTRYGRLLERMDAYLPADDALRIDAMPVVQRQLDAWVAADEEVDDARGQLELAVAAKAHATEAWERALTEVYGLLLGRVGKERAERYFPKSRRAAPRAAAEPAPEPCAPDVG